MPAVSAAPGHSGRFGRKPDAGLQPLWNFVGEPVEIFVERYGATVRRPTQRAGSSLGAVSPRARVRAHHCGWGLVRADRCDTFAGLTRASFPAPRGTFLQEALVSTV